jgi:isopenicillin N synthase-like dioxygenase
MVTTQVPIIDFGPYIDPNATELQRLTVAKAIDEACRNIGQVPKSGLCLLVVEMINIVLGSSS